MSERSPVSLDLLQAMVQRVLDGQTMLREDVRNVRRRLSRIEHAIASVQRAEVDRHDDEIATQDQLDALAARLDRLEGRAS